MNNLTRNTLKVLNKTSTFNQIRGIHRLAPIAPELRQSLSKTLFPVTNLSLIDQERSVLLEQLNDLIKDTHFEHLTLYKTIVRSAPFLDKSLIFNLSSQLWNQSFFLESLAADVTPIRYDLEQRLIKDFGSLQGFKDEFKKAALSQFGNGWTWLVEDDKGTLKIVNTKSSGTPLIPGRMNQYEGYTYQQIVDHVSKLNLPYTLPVDKEVGAYHPVLAINMWDTAYAVDYKCNKEAYVNQFITYIDWNVIHKRLFPGFR